MRRAVVVMAISAVIAMATVVITGAMGIAVATPNGNREAAVVRKKLNNIYHKLGSVQARVEHLEYEVSRVFSCAQHLDDRLKGNTAELRGSCVG